MEVEGETELREGMSEVETEDELQQRKEGSKFALHFSYQLFFTTRCIVKKQGPKFTLHLLHLLLFCKCKKGGFKI